MANEPITFTINGLSFRGNTAVTNSSGIATLNNVSLAGISPGTYPSRRQLPGRPRQILPAQQRQQHADGDLGRKRGQGGKGVRSRLRAEKGSGAV